MKRFYIAVGSTALNALSALVRRYHAYGELLDDSKGPFDDVFVAIDSDIGKVKDFQALSDNRRRLVGIQMEMDEEICRLSHSVRSGDRDLWPLTDIIHPNGVGGNRRVSFRTLKMFDNHLFQDILARIEEGDTVILVGSAFGGTSTGSYWNMATYLRQYLNTKSANERWRSRCATFYGFVIFPNLDEWQKFFGGPGNQKAAYRFMSSNVCYFLRDMDEIRICRTILDAQDNTLSFAPISLALSGSVQQPSKQNTFGILRKGESTSDTSCLPMDALFLVPTNGLGSSSAVSSLVGEELFLFSRIGVGTVSQRGGGDTIGSKLVNQKDAIIRNAPAWFSEFNFIAARTPRKWLSSKFVYEDCLSRRMREFGRRSEAPSLDERWQTVESVIREGVERDKGTDLDAAIKETVRTFISDIFSGHQTGARHVNVQDIVLQARASATPYVGWKAPVFLSSVLSTYLDEKNVQPGSVAYPTQSGEVPFHLSDVRHLHEEIYAPIQEERGDYGRKKKDLESLAAEFEAKLLEEIDARHRIPLWTKATDKTRVALDEELKEEAIQAMEDVLKKIRNLERCQKTVIPNQDAEFARLEGLYLGFSQQYEDEREGKVPCISKPRFSKQIMGQFWKDFNVHGDDVYPASSFFSDAKAVADGAFNEVEKSKRIDILSSALLQKIDKVYEDPGKVDQRTRLNSSTFDGPEIGTLVRPYAEDLQKALLDGVDSDDNKWRFMVEFSPGDHRKTEVSNGEENSAASVTYGDVQACFGRPGQALFPHPKPGDPFKTNKGENPFPNGRLRLGAVDGTADPNLDGLWMGVLHLDRSLSGFLTDTYAPDAMRLAAEENRCIDFDRDQHEGHSRLLHHSEAVQIGLVLGIAGKKVCEAYKENSTCRGVRISGIDISRDYLGKDGNGLASASPKMVAWARQFIKDNPDIFESSETGAKEFFEDLDQREKSVMKFSNNSALFNLDYNVVNRDVGPHSLRTLHAIAQAIADKLSVTVDN